MLDQIKKMPRKKRDFEINNEKFFLTYSQCSLTPEEVKQGLPLPENIRGYVIGQERHEDLGLHIHAVVWYSERVRSTDPRYFDIMGFHPNIKTLKTKGDLQRTAKYASKDGIFIQEGDLLKKSREEIFEALVQAGEVTAQYVRENPSVLSLNFQSIRGWLSLLGGPSLVNQKSNSLPKKRHMYLYGSSNTGKSTWLYAFLKKFQKTASIPLNNDWFQCNKETEVLYSDEYKGHLSIQQLNLICDGCTTLNTKGSSTVILQPLVVIVSNFDICTNYPSIDQDLLNTFHNRFIVFKSDVALPPL